MKTSDAYKTDSMSISDNKGKLQFLQSTPLDPLTSLLKKQRDVQSESSISNAPHINKNDNNALNIIPNELQSLGNQYPLGKELFSYVTSKHNVKNINHSHPTTSNQTETHNDKEPIIRSNNSLVLPCNSCTYNQVNVLTNNPGNTIKNEHCHNDSQQLLSNNIKSVAMNLKPEEQFDKTVSNYILPNHPIAEQPHFQNCVYSPQQHIQSNHSTVDLHSPLDVPIVSHTTTLHAQHNLPTSRSHSVRHSRLNRPIGLEKQVSRYSSPRPFPSTITAITQNVLGHARDLQAMARSAATTLLNSAGPVRSAFLDDNDLTPGLDTNGHTHSLTSFSIARDFEDFCQIEGCDSNQLDWDKFSTLWNLYKDTVISLSGVSKNHMPQHSQSLRSGLYDPKITLLGPIELGWDSIPPVSNKPYMIIKCNSCLSVQCCVKSNQDKYITIPILPESLLERFSFNSDMCQTKDQYLISFHSQDVVGIQHYLKRYANEIIITTLRDVNCIWGTVPPIIGQLVCTNYRLIFDPCPKRNPCDIVIGTLWMQLCNFWEIPLALIDRIHQGHLNSKEKTYFLYRFATLSKQTNYPHKTPITLPKKKKECYDDVLIEHSKSYGRQDDCCIEIHTKDHRQFRLFIRQDDTQHNELELLLHSLLQTETSSLFALSFLRSRDSEQETLNVYAPESEWLRMISKENHWLRITHSNENYELCSTYPKLLVVPCHINDEMLRRIAGFRCKQRLPILSWCSTQDIGSLWRCSQPKSMFQRCTEDELFLSIIAHSSLSHRLVPLRCYPLLIIDARPLINAVVNKASGAGFENTSSHYKDCRIEFANIDNIHHVRNAWKKMMSFIGHIITQHETFPSFYRMSQLSSYNILSKNEHHGLHTCSHCSSPYPWNQLCPISHKHLMLCVDPNKPQWIYSQPTPPLSGQSSTNYTTYIQQLSGSSWYDYIQRILRAVNLAVSQLNQGEAVVIHCSDGWDRTSQITSLTMLCIDAYYRSIKGFIILIEQEFLHAGHQFHTRCGHPGKFSSTKQSYTQQTKGSNLSRHYKKDCLTKSNRLIKDSIQEDKSQNYLYKQQAHVIEPDDIMNEKDSPILSETEGRHASASHLRQQQSPIFIQWLDCVYQIMVQFPTAFEFTTGLLDVLASEIYSCFYGTFLYDNPKERETAGVSQRTVSLWDHILRVKINFSRYNNYSPTTNQLLYPIPLYPNTQQIAVWNSYWFRHRPSGLDYIARSTVISRMT